MNKIILAVLALALFPFLGQAVNTPPTIATITNQSVWVDHPALVKLYVGDLETPIDALQLTWVSSNPALIPAENVVFHYYPWDAEPPGTFWYITVVPAFGLTGTATNTVTVSDGTNSASTSFVLTVNPPPVGAVRFSNSSSLTIPDAGAATPYPSTINVAGTTGTITNVTLTVSGFNHQYPADVHMLLVGPTNQGVVIWAKCGGGTEVTNITVTLTDAAPFPLPGPFKIWSEELCPTNRALTNLFPQPAPAGPYGTNLSAFNGQPANGAWSLYVYDDEAPDHGSIAAGWSLMIATTGPALPRILSLYGAGTTSVVIRWSAISNVTYRVQYQSISNPTSWSNLAPDITATSSAASATDNSATLAGRLYRIQAVP